MKKSGMTWHFPASETAAFGSLIAGFPYASELAGPGGVHMHFWLPGNASKALLAKVEHEARSQHDAVAIDWEPFTPEVRDWLKSKTPPKGFIAATMDALIQHRANGGGMLKLFWGKGRRLTVDGFSFSALMVVYEALNDANKAKFREFIEAGPGGLAKMVEISFQMVGTKK